MPACKVLVVDDDADDRDILIETFQQIGVARVEGVDSAEAAIAFLQAIPADQDLPKLIITDLNMPGISGSELLCGLKQMSRYQHIPVIVCSTSSSPKEMENCLASGATDYVTKPSAVSDYVQITHRLNTLVCAE